MVGVAFHYKSYYKLQGLVSAGWGGGKGVILVYLAIRKVPREQNISGVDGGQ
jgi:hypothetical protein